MKRLWLSLVLVSTFVAGTLLGLVLALPGRSFLEAVEEGLGPLLAGPPQTKLAPSLRDPVFSSLPLGATEPEALAALGPPLSRRSCSGGTICWDYSQAMNSDASYVRRILVFDGSGRLVKKYMGYSVGD